MRGGVGPAPCAKNERNSVERGAPTSGVPATLVVFSLSLNHPPDDRDCDFDWIHLSLDDCGNAYATSPGTSSVWSSSREDRCVLGDRWPFLGVVANIVLRMLSPGISSTANFLSVSCGA